MFDHDYTTTFSVDETPENVFNAINNVRGWWGTDVEGNTSALGDVFIFRVKDIHRSKIEVTELVPNQKVVWRVLDNHLNFVEDQSEWVGTTITFDISRSGDQTEVRFAHLGLYPSFECYGVCSNAWGGLMHGSLRNLITTGSGNPY